MSFNQGHPSSFPGRPAGGAPQRPTSDAPMDNDAVPPRYAPTSTDSEANKYASAKDMKIVQDDIKDIFKILAQMQRPQETPRTAAPSGTTTDPDPSKEKPSKEKPPKEPSATQSIAAAVVAHAQLESELEKQYCAISSVPKKDPNSEERATGIAVFIRNVGSENATHHTTIAKDQTVSTLVVRWISKTMKMEDRPKWIMEHLSKEGYISALRYYNSTSDCHNWLTTSTFNGSAPTTESARTTPWQLIPVKKGVFKMKLLFDESYRVLALENWNVVLQQEKPDDKFQLWMFDSIY